MSPVEIALCMIAGLVTLVVLFAFRVVALIAGVIGGFALVGLVLAYGAWSATPDLAHWHNVTKAIDLTTLCIAVTVIAGFGPMWAFGSSNRVQTRYRA